MDWKRSGLKFLFIFFLAFASFFSIRKLVTGEPTSEKTEQTKEEQDKKKAAIEKVKKWLSDSGVVGKGLSAFANLTDKFLLAKLPESITIAEMLPFLNISDGPVKDYLDDIVLLRPKMEPLTGEGGLEISGHVKINEVNFKSVLEFGLKNKKPYIILSLESADTWKPSQLFPGKLVLSKLFPKLSPDVLAKFKPDVFELSESYFIVSTAEVAGHKKLGDVPQGIQFKGKAQFIEGLQIIDKAFGLDERPVEFSGKITPKLVGSNFTVKIPNKQFDIVKDFDLKLNDFKTEVEILDGYKPQLTADGEVTLKIPFYDDPLSFKTGIAFSIDGGLEIASDVKVNEKTFKSVLNIGLKDKKPYFIFYLQAPDPWKLSQVIPVKVIKDKLRETAPFKNLIKDKKTNKAIDKFEPDIFELDDSLLLISSIDIEDYKGLGKVIKGAAFKSKIKFIGPLDVIDKIFALDKRPVEIAGTLTPKFAGSKFLIKIPFGQTVIPEKFKFKGEEYTLIKDFNVKLDPFDFKIEILGDFKPQFSGEGGINVKFPFYRDPLVFRGGIDFFVSGLELYGMQKTPIKDLFGIKDLEAEGVKIGLIWDFQTAAQLASATVAVGGIGALLPTGFEFSGGIKSKKSNISIERIRAAISGQKLADIIVKGSGNFDFKDFVEFWLRIIANKPDLVSKIVEKIPYFILENAKLDIRWSDFEEKGLTLEVGKLEFIEGYPAGGKLEASKSGIEISGYLPTFKIKSPVDSKKTLITVTRKGEIEEGKPEQMGPNFEVKIGISPFDYKVKLDGHGDIDLSDFGLGKLESDVLVDISKTSLSANFESSLLDIKSQVTLNADVENKKIKWSTLRLAIKGQADLDLREFVKEWMSKMFKGVSEAERERIVNEKIPDIKLKNARLDVELSKDKQHFELGVDELEVIKDHPAGGTIVIDAKDPKFSIDGYLPTLKLKDPLNPEKTLLTITTAKPDKKGPSFDLKVEQVTEDGKKTVDYNVKVDGKVELDLAAFGKLESATDIDISKTSLYGKFKTAFLGFDSELEMKADVKDKKPDLKTLELNATLSSEGLKQLSEALRKVDKEILAPIKDLLLQDKSAAIEKTKNGLDKAIEYWNKKMQDTAKEIADLKRKMAPIQKIKDDMMELQAKLKRAKEHCEARYKKLQYLKKGICIARELGLGIPRTINDAKKLVAKLKEEAELGIKIAKHTAELVSLGTKLTALGAKQGVNMSNKKLLEGAKTATKIAEKVLPLLDADVKKALQEVERFTLKIAKFSDYIDDLLDKVLKITYASISTKVPELLSKTPKLPKIQVKGKALGKYDFDVTLEFDSKNITGFVKQLFEQVRKQIKDNKKVDIVEEAEDLIITEGEEKPKDADYLIVK